MHPLDGVGVDVRGRHLHRGGEVEDQRVVGAWARAPRRPRCRPAARTPARCRCRTPGEYSKRISVSPMSSAYFLHSRAADVAMSAMPSMSMPEHHAALQRGGGVVEVDDGLLGPDQGLVGARDQVLAGLGQHLDGDVVGDPVGLDQRADEVEVGLARRREADLDLLVAEPDEQVEHPHLALDVHRVDERLVAVAQVDRAPARGGLDAPVWPGAVRQLDAQLLVEGDVAPEGHAGGLLGVDRGGHLGFLACGVGLGAGRAEPPRRGGRPVSGPRRGDQAGGLLSARRHRTRRAAILLLSDVGGGMPP